MRATFFPRSSRFSDAQSALRKRLLQFICHDFNFSELLLNKVDSKNTNIIELDVTKNNMRKAAQQKCQTQTCASFSNYYHKLLKFALIIYEHVSLPQCRINKIFSFISCG